MEEKKSLKRFNSFRSIPRFWNIYKLFFGKRNSQYGFTLVELLVVIAVLGILAVGLLAAINPQEQINKAKDVIRKGNISVINRELESYFTSNQCYPTDLSQLSLKSIPTDNSCNGGSCYAYSYDNSSSCPKWGIVYAKLDSASATSSCAATCSLPSGLTGTVYCLVNSTATVDCSTTVTSSWPGGTSGSGGTGGGSSSSPTPTPSGSTGCTCSATSYHIDGGTCQANGYPAYTGSSQTRYYCNILCSDVPLICP